MGLDTDFNQSPYFDDFSEDKNFHRVLFKPGVAVQARELTQLQTILQDQIERFGNNILKEGTIIKGCNFTEIQDLAYIKILDLQTTGEPVSMSTYLNARAVGLTTGVTAKIILVDSGLQTQFPDLATLYVKYLLPGASAKQFSTTENIEIRNFTTGAVIATVTAAGTVNTGDSAAVGQAYGVKTGDGIIYQKGAFVRVESQEIVVSKYSNIPDDVVVGFQTVETIINSNSDTSLLDNANGFNNYNAPGADRLQLTPVLVKKTLAEAIGDETFFSIQEYALGGVVRRNRTTQYSGITDMIEQRTKEESGNYVVKDYRLTMGQGANTDYVSVFVGSGVSYVEGKRVELVNTYDLLLRKATDSQTEADQTISTNIGHYILVNEYMGSFDTNTLGSVNLYDAAQDRATAGSVGTPSGNLIGTAKLRAFVYESGTIGTATARYRAYIVDIKMASGKNWSQVLSIYNNATNKGVADLVSNTIYESAFKRALFPVGRSGLKAMPAADTTADFVYRTVDKSRTLQNNNTSFTIDLAATGSEWPYTGTLNATQVREDILIIANATQSPYVAGKPIDLSSATVSISGTTMTISGLTAPTTGDVPVIAYYNAKRTSNPAAKDLETIYVKIDCSSAGVNGPYYLGVPDVYSIENVYVGTTYSTGNTDRKTSFTLNNGQRDAFYGISYLVKSKTLSLTTSNRILIKLKVFRKNASGGDGYFTVNSYPTANTVSDTKITWQQISYYRSENGTIYDLRNTLDFRPVAANTAAYAATEGAATVNPASTLSFGTSEVYACAPNEDYEASYEYYLARKDILFINGNGTFDIREGVAAENPAPPSEPKAGMVLADISVPVFPSLPGRVASLASRPDLGVDLVKRDNRRFTMKDIAGIEKRISNIEYYTALNLLESKTKDLIIPGADGLNRFKNGIFVDNFEDLSAANIKDPNYNAGIDPAYKEITPKFNTYPLSLKYVSGTNIDKYGDVVTLNKSSSKSIINQPYATTFRNTATNFYKYTGYVDIWPSYDSAYDTTTAPDVLNVDIDIATPFIEFVENLSNFYPLVTQSMEVTNQTTSLAAAATTSETTLRTTVTTNTTTSTELKTKTQSITQDLGEFVTDIRFNPFMRSRPIRIYASGLRPNTQHYFFFDGVNVAEHVAPADYKDGEEEITENLRRTRSLGTTVTTDSNGILKAVFVIPEETFYVGDRELVIIDVDEVSAFTALTSKTQIVYHAFNYSTNKSAVSVTTRSPVFDTVVSSTNKDVITEQVVANPNFVRPVVPPQSVNRDDLGGESDPIAQTFMIRDSMSNDSVVFVDKIDLFFREKSSTNGVIVQIRETDNGYPSSARLPFGTVRLKPSQVVTSTTSAAIPTTVTFPAPVALTAGIEYCVVVQPEANDPDYLIYTSKVGERDIDSGLPITSDSNPGTLFTSTNNLAWTAYQDENMKFQLYKAQFDTSGTVNFTNDDHEFLSVSNVGVFRIGEQVGVMNANVSAQTISTDNDSKVITASGGLGIFETGDYLGYYANTTVVDFVQVKTATSATSLTLYETPKYSNTSTTFFKTVVGEISYFDRNTPAQIHLKNSSAKSGNIFEDGDIIRGEISQATATIDTVDDLKISYLQPNVYKTNFQRTNTVMNATILKNAAGTNYVSSAPKNLPFNQNTLLNQTATVIKSRSSEVTSGGNSFQVQMSLTNNATVADTSPFIDFAISNITGVEYLINNVVDDGTTTELDGQGEGPATSKYVSKTVELAQGFNSDDLSVFLTGYRPPSTSILVYARFKNELDPRDFDEIEWTRLSLKNNSNLTSSAANRFDYREFEYYVPSQDAGDFSAGSGAALNADNNNILRYIDDDGIIYDNYKFFALKVVLLSTSHKDIPKLKDIRAIALT